MTPEHERSNRMARDSAKPDELSALLAEHADVDAEELEERADSFRIAAPEDADWEYIDE